MSVLNQNIAIFNRIDFKDKLLFTKHLSIMIKSGIPLADALAGLRDQTQNKALRDLFSSLYLEVAGGHTLGQSIAKFPKVFDPLYIGLIKTGEESGTLDANLGYLAIQLRKEYESRKKIQGVLLYPAIVLTAASIVGLGVSYFLLPQLSQLFDSLDVTLPLSTRILLGIADFIKRFGVFIPFALVGALAGFRLFIALAWVKPYWHAFLLRVPLFGPFLRDVQLSTLFRNMGIMLKSGLPITLILEIQRQSTTNLVFKKYIARLAEAVDHGKSIEQELDTNTYHHIPQIASKMIGVGERSGNLDESLTYLGEFFEEEVDTVSKNLSTVLEPILLLVIGLVVAFVAFSIITPLYQLTSGIHK
ncbi:MAG: type II secretion system F family protein [Candidatus Woesebacteria bacterium]